MGYLLDTSVCSQPLKRTPIYGVIERWDMLGDTAAMTSQVCIAEIEWGLHKLNSERRWEGFKRDVLPSLKILSADRSVWSVWARMKARQQALGLGVGDLDLLIGATAVQHNLIVATLNVSHFSKVEGLRWEDWSA